MLLSNINDRYHLLDCFNINFNNAIKKKFYAGNVSSFISKLKLSKFKISGSSILGLYIYK